MTWLIENIFFVEWKTFGFIIGKEMVKYLNKADYGYAPKWDKIYSWGSTFHILYCLNPTRPVATHFAHT